MLFGDLTAEVSRWFREDIDPDILADACNDAIDSLWSSIVLLKLGRLLGGPVTATFAAAAERLTLTKIADPLGAPATAAVAGGNLGIRNLSITFTLVTGSGGETLESPATAQAVGANQVAKVTSPAFVAGTIGYHVYAGDAAGRRARQTEEPYPFGTDYTEPETGWIDNPALPSPPVVNSTFDDLLYITQLELKTSSGGYRRWTGTELDSQLMKAAASQVASNSEYQDYFYCVTNENSVEVRPAMGTTLSPRFFYVKKFARLRYANADCPFDHRRFLRPYALSNLFLSVHEYPAADIWMGRANQVRTEILLELNQGAGEMDQTIRPFMR